MDSPKTFSDSLGRSWRVDLTLAGAERMREITGVSLDDFVPKAERSGKSDPDMMPLQAFISDPYKVFDVFCALVKPQADALGIDKKKMLEGFDSDAAVDAMGLAVLQAIHDFFRRDPIRQTLIRRVAKIGLQVMTAAAAKVEAAMDKIDVATIAANLPEIDTVAATDRAIEALKKSAGNTSVMSAPTTPAA